MGLIDDLRIALTQAQGQFNLINAQSQSQNPTIANIAGRQLALAAGELTTAQTNLQAALLSQQDEIMVSPAAQDNTLRNLLLIGGLLLII